MDLQFRKHCVFLIMLILITSMNVVVLYYLVTSFLIDPPTAEPLCDVIPINVWSNSSSHQVNNLPRPVGLVVVTHTVTRQCDTTEVCAQILNAIRNRHIREGRADIALSFIVGGNGEIYEGAGWRVGSHTVGYSERSISLTFIGDFREVLPTEAALKAAENFLGCFLNTRYLACDYSLVGHQQLITTQSPGAALQNHIQTWPHWTRKVKVQPIEDTNNS